MLKAKELENEMYAVRKAKIDSVLRQFEQQLQRDALLEQNRIKEQLSGEYDTQVNQLEAEKNSNIDEVEKLQKQLKDQIDFFQKVHSELDGKKQDLQNTYQASVQYLRKEMTEQEQAQRKKLLKHMEEKTTIFRNYISSQSDQQQ